MGHVDDGLLVRSDPHLEILRRFRAAGIEIPAPHFVLRPGGDKGTA